jgi:phytoene dehydrogenase-like protein
MSDSCPDGGGRYDAIVIGGGHNGLTAATYLAKGGFKVCLLERSGTLGGMCQTSEVLPGVRGNLAANSAHNLDPTVVAELALADHGLEWIDVGSPSSFALLPDQGRIVAYADDARRRAEFEQFGRGEADAYEQTMAEMTALGQKLDVSFYDPPPRFADVAARVEPGREEDFFRRAMFGSVTDLASERLRSEQVRASLSMLAVAGNFIGPSSPGSAYALMQRPMYRGAQAARKRAKASLTAEFGSHSPRGGMGAITRAMASAARAAGVEVRTESGVDEVKVGPVGVEGVVTEDGTELDAPVVAAAINPKLTLLDLVPEASLDPEFRASVEALDMRGCMAKIYLALDGEPQFAAARDAAENAVLGRCGFRSGPTIAAMDSAYVRALDGGWDGEPVVYGLIQTRFDDSLAQGGPDLMSLSVSYAPYDLAEGTWDTVKDKWVRHVIDWLGQHIVNLDDIIVDSGCLTPAELESRFGLLGGNALHGDVTAANMFTWRPVSGCGDYGTPLQGLYLCSNGTWPANYVSGLPGRNAARQILDARAGQADRSFQSETTQLEKETC